MKLCKLYSNDKRFKTVTFNDGFNVVLGKITNKKRLDRNAHCLGKSTMIELIDFMLLKTIDKTHFLKREQFANHVFFLELRTNSGEYVTIRRATRDNTRISLKKHSDENFDGRQTSSWDYEDLPLTSSKKEKNPKVILNKWLGFDVFEGEDYRKKSGYFLRTQDDYSDVFKLNKYKGKDKDWKPILFELLGFDSEHMIRKYELSNELEEKKQEKDRLKNEGNSDYEKRDRLQGQIELAEAEKARILKQLDEFDFYQKEAKIDKEVVDKVENEISRLNTERYNLDFELSQIDESLAVRVDYDLKKTLKIYEEVQIYFPNQVVKKYEELVDFNNKLSRERMKYLIEAKTEKKKRREIVDNCLSDLNRRRVELLKGLKETQTFAKYNEYRQDLINVEKELQQCQMELSLIDQEKTIQKEILKIEGDLNTETLFLNNQIDESNSLYKQIRKDFHDFVLEVSDSEATLSLEMNGKENVDFKASFYKANKETAQGLGHTYRKLLCACFDLAIIKNYMNKSFYRFIYHDGCLESLDPRVQLKFLKLVKRVASENNIQYILTCLSSELPKEEEFRISEDEIAVELSDVNDDGKLFGFSF